MVFYAHIVTLNLNSIQKTLVMLIQNYTDQSAWIHMTSPLFQMITWARYIFKYENV